METVIAIVVVLGFVIRVVLDIASIIKPSLALDLAYGVLFVIVGAALFIGEGASFWAWACAGIAAFSFISAAGKVQAQTAKSEGGANGAP